MTLLEALAVAHQRWGAIGSVSVDEQRFIHHGCISIAIQVDDECIFLTRQNFGEIWGRDASWEAALADASILGDLIIRGYTETWPVAAEVSP